MSSDAPLPDSTSIAVFLGTKAQYIKTAPLLRLLDEQAVPYRLIDSGQHGALSGGLRQELGIRDPDLVLGDGRNVDTIPQAILWALRILTLLARPRRLREQIFAGVAATDAGARPLCIVHGDTPSTMLATVLARRAGLEVAHLEAGLTSGRLLDPIPEEAIRRLVMRWSSLLFTPDAVATAHLRSRRVKGRIVELAANTVVEATTFALESAGEISTGPAVVTMHRVENLQSTARVAGFIDLVLEMAAREPVLFVTHGPTEQVLRKLGHLAALEAAGIEVLPLQPHGAFVRMLAAAPWVITDGGSIQEECALLGVPTLLWRQRSERPDGIGVNVVVSEHDPTIARAFLADPAAHRVGQNVPATRPSEQILAQLRAR
ncbi:MAG: UDP-N-acetylglucosamine 2-epimerase (non-hydrolyzing) [Glaciecola sp.]|jgi:UDP-N-acetylglucosamine 2-epimerase (non-hydrolysing)